MVKNRVGQQIKDALYGSKSHSKKSVELDYLSGQFKQLKMRIRALIESLKLQHVSLLRTNESRLMVSTLRKPLILHSLYFQFNSSIHTETIGCKMCC